MDKTPKPVNVFDLMSPEDQAKVLKRSAEIEQIQSNGITKEWATLAELGTYLGYGAIKAVLEDEITIEQAGALLEGARKTWAGQVYDMAVASLAGNSKKASGFEALLKQYTSKIGVKD